MVGRPSPDAAAAPPSRLPVSSCPYAVAAAAAAASALSIDLVADMPGTMPLDARLRSGGSGSSAADTDGTSRPCDSGRGERGGRACGTGSCSAAAHAASPASCVPLRSRERRAGSARAAAADLLEYCTASSLSHGGKGGATCDSKSSEGCFGLERGDSPGARGGRSEVGTSAERIGGAPRTTSSSARQPPLVPFVLPAPRAPGAGLALFARAASAALLGVRLAALVP
eukprot:365855-Chlamydomonas_euryale.AAC.5